MIKSTMFFFMNIANKYKIRTIILVVYSIFSGYIISFWPILIKEVYTNPFVRIQLMIIFIIHFSYEYIKELILFPIYNQASYKLKLNTITNIHEIALDRVSSGKTIAKFQRSSSGKYIFQNLISIFKYSTTIFNNLYLIFCYDKILGLVIFCILLFYISIIFLFKKFYLRLRKKAWEATEQAAHLCQQTIDQTIAIRQSFIENTSYNSIYNEFIAWHNYYLKSNLYLATLSLLAVLIIYITFLFKSEFTIIFLAWNLANALKSLNSNLKTIISTSVDINLLLNKEKQTMHTNRFYTTDINIENVTIHNKLGPFNLSTKARLIGVKGENGIGKTQLALAIAGLIPFEGKISAPKALYISLKNQANINLSNGENAMQILDKALESEFEMVIIDELLEVLSAINLNNYINKLLDTKKSIMLISHKDNILKNTQAIFDLSKII